MLKNKSCKSYLFVFLFSLLLSAIMFLPFVIYDRGMFLFFGDYNVQQIPFYSLCHDAVRSGNIFWDWTTDLGVNFLGSYSFYTLGSPFFWLTIPFPNSFVPYLMAPLFCLKFSVAAVCAFGFIKRFIKNQDYALIGALLYAFSGFNVYNVFFNHFNDVTAFFPLLLIALDELVENNRKGVFSLAVALMAIINYFFFFGQVVFLFIYFFIRLFSGSYKNFKVSKIFFIAAESLIGVGLSLFILLPSVSAILGNPRVDSFKYGIDLLVYSQPQKYLAIIQSFFFPPDLPSRTNFFPDAGIKWTSLSGYLPLFSMVGVFAFMRSKKQKFLKRIIVVLTVMAFVPFLNSSFFAFNSSYYARWFYMLTLMLSLATAISLDSEDVDFESSIKWTAGITLFFTIVGVIPSKTDDGVIEWFSIPPYPERFWAYVCIAILSIILLGLILFYMRKFEKFTRYLTAAVCAIVLIYSYVYIGTGKGHSYESDFIIDKGIYGARNIELERSSFYRVDEFEGMDNQTLFWKFNTMRCFHSIVPASTIEFYDSIGVSRGVSSKPSFNMHALRSLMSVKYIFSDADKDKRPTTYGFKYIDTQNGFDIYENLNFIPMGFTYDSYMEKEEYLEYSKNLRNELLIKYIVLDSVQIGKYAQNLTRSDQIYYDYSYEAYETECDRRAANSCYFFEETKRGFIGKINLDKSNLVFFSVPYDKGFKAYVNGVETKIENVSIGMSAVYCEEGENTIEFVFTPQGFKEGMLVSIVSLLLLAAYVALNLVFCKKRYVTDLNDAISSDIKISDNIENLNEMEGENESDA